MCKRKCNAQTKHLLFKQNICSSNKTFALQTKYLLFKQNICSSNKIVALQTKYLLFKQNSCSSNKFFAPAAQTAVRKPPAPAGQHNYRTYSRFHTRMCTKYLLFKQNIWLDNTTTEHLADFIHVCTENIFYSKRTHSIVREHIL